MIYRRIIAACFILVLAVSACALGQETVKFEMKFKAGELLRYKMIMDGSVSLGGLPNMPQASNVGIRAVAVVRQRVKRVLPNGDAEITSVAESGRCTFGNKTYDLPMTKMPVQTFIMDKNGLVKSLTGTQKCPLPVDFEKFSALPTGELALGESWSQGVPFPGGTMMVIGSVVSLDEKLGNSRVAVIKQDVSADLDLGKALAGIANNNQMVPQGVTGKGKLTATGTTFFSQEKGRVVRTEGVMDAQMEATGPMPSSQPTQGGGDVTAYFLMHLSFELYLLPS